MSRWFEDESLSTGRALLMILFNRVRGGDVEMRFAGRPEGARKILVLNQPDSGGRCPTSLAA
jgi:hypothetical protein